MKQIYLILLLVLLFSCKTLNETTASGIDEESMNVINEIILLGMEMIDNPAKDIIDQIEKKHRFLKGRSRNNKYFEAKIAGIEGEIAFYSGNLINYEKSLKTIARLNPREEWFYYLESLQIKDIEKKISYLKNAMIQAQTDERLRIILADTYFFHGIYDLAVVQYDDVMRENYQFSTMQRTRRDMSLYFVEHKPQSIITPLVATKTSITPTDFINMLYNEVEIIRKITKNIKPAVDEWHKRGYVYTTNSQPITKKFAAYTFYSITNNQQISNEVKERLKVRKSVFEDVKGDSLFYDPILFSVQWELLSMEEKNIFSPDKIMSGIECYKAIKKAEEYYAME